MQKRVKNIIRKIAKETGHNEHLVAAVVRSQFECAKDVIQNADPNDKSSFKNIRFKYIGLLRYRPRKFNNTKTGSNDK